MLCHQIISSPTSDRFTFITGASTGDWRLLIIYIFRLRLCGFDMRADHNAEQAISLHRR